MTSPSTLQTLNWQIEGMTCASCVARVERSLAKVGGVASAQANLATESVQVSFEAPATPAALKSVLDQAGYPVRESRVSLRVEGMTCASCVGRVERVLKKTPGVVDAAVNLANETAEITYWTGTTDATRLAQAISDSGYPAHAPQSNDATLAERKASESASWARAMGLSAALGVPVMVLAMGGHISATWHQWMMSLGAATWNAPVQWLLTTAIMVGPGRYFYMHGFRALFKGAPDMNSLVALGTSAAYLYSVVATALPELLPESARHVYFEAAAMIIVLIALGRTLEARAKGRTGAAIAKLMGLRPKTAQVWRDAQWVEVALEAIQVGDVIQVFPGQKIAVDGLVTEGESYVDESMLTGEPMPQAKTPGAWVTAGTVNGQGSLQVKAQQVGADTALAHIIRMVEQAQGAKLPIQAMVDRITAWFVPAVLVAAAITVGVWLIWGPEPAMTQALVAGVSVLIIACPCAMGLATPTSIMVGTGRSAELGVLFRQGDALQALQGVQLVAFDKTGTLTQGKPSVVDAWYADGADSASARFALQAAASVEHKSEHPLAKAVLDWANQSQLGALPVDGFQAVTGWGVQGHVNGQLVQAGAWRWMSQLGVDVSAAQSNMDAWAARGQSGLWVVVDGRLCAGFAVSDTVKPGAHQAVRALQDMGMRVAMVTGDHAASAHALAQQLGLDEVLADVLPHDKAKAVQQWQSQWGRVAFVGDGINDAPALARADVGVAIGTGTDVAVEAADVVLMSGDVRGVVNAIHMSQATLRNIRQNLFWAFGYNVVLIPVAAGALFPVWGWMLSPILASAAMALSSVFVLSNALRLRWVPALKPEGSA